MTDVNSPVINTTDKTFDVDVMERSRLGLVVVDFWAEWCAPCRMLGPVLEQIAVEAEGEFTLVKAQTDHNPNAATQFAVGGIPAVFAVYQGEVLDRFEGALPEAAIREWLSGLEGQITLQDAIALVDSDPSAGLEQLRSLAGGVERDEVLIQLAKIFWDNGCREDVQAILDRLEARGFLEAEAEQIKSKLALESHSGGDIDDLRKQASLSPDDLALQLTLAKALVGGKEYPEAFDLCLDLVERDRQKTGEEARELMVEVFTSMPADAELVSEYRRKLSMLLF